MVVDKNNVTYKDRAMLESNSEAVCDAKGKRMVVVDRATAILLLALAHCPKLKNSLME